MSVFHYYEGGRTRRARKTRPRDGQYQTVDYRLFIGPDGGLFFKIVDNDDTGTHPNLYFSVSKYWNRGFKSEKILAPEGLIDVGITATSFDQNASGFIKAVIRNIPEKIAAKFDLKLPEKQSKKQNKATKK